MTKKKLDSSGVLTEETLQKAIDSIIKQGSTVDNIVPDNLLREFFANNAIYKPGEWVLVDNSFIGEIINYEFGLDALKIKMIEDETKVYEEIPVTLTEISSTQTIVKIPKGSRLDTAKVLFNPSK